MSEMDVAFLLVLYLCFCYNKGNKFVKVTHTMNYMHLLVGHPTQKSKKLEVCCQLLLAILFYFEFGLKNVCVISTTTHFSGW